MITVLEYISIGILVFFLIYCVVTVALLALSIREISWYARGQQPSALDGKSSRTDRASAS